MSGHYQFASELFRSQLEAISQHLMDWPHRSPDPETEEEYDFYWLLAITGIRLDRRPDLVEFAKGLVGTVIPALASNDDTFVELMVMGLAAIAVGFGDIGEPGVELF